MENVEKKPKSTKNTNAKDVEKKVSTSKASKANATTQDRAVKSNASKQSASKRGAKTEPKQTDEVVKGQEVAVDTANVERNSSSDDFSIQSQGERIKKNAGKNSKRKKAAIATAVVLLVTASVAIPTAVYLSRRKVSVDISNNIDVIQEYTVNIKRGAAIKDIVPQEITGYTFVGFYKDAELTVPYKDTDKINKNMTIYAKYEANVYKVTFPTSPAFTIEGEDILNNQVEIEYNTEYRFRLNLATGYNESDITVKVNGETVTPDQDGYYTLTIYGDTLVEVEGVEINTYEVTFYDSLEKNEIYQRLDIDYNQLCTYTGVTPTKHSTHTYTYTFIGWVDAEGNEVDLSTTRIVTDLELFANFREEYIEYTITKPEQVNVKFGDLYLSPLSTLHYGDIVEITYDTTEGHDVTAFSVSGAEKVEGSENQYKITGNLVVTYTEEIQKFTVQIESSNFEYGSINQSSITVEYGTEIIVSGNTLTIGEYTITATPTADDPTYDYVFVNWTNAVSEVTGDMTITANFERTMDEYVVSIVVNNASYGTVSKASVIVNYNTPITVDGNKLTINGQEIIATATASDAQYTYTFTGWTNPTDPITGNREITANFTRETNTYTVSIQSNNTGYGTVDESSITVEYGTRIAVDGNTLTIGEYTITATPTTSTAQYSYSFASWSTGNTTVTGEITITATFTQAVQTYTVTWKNWDGTTLETDTSVPYGTTPEYNGETPTREETASHSYTFTGWDQELNPVTGDITYTAVFDSEIKASYDFTIVDGTIMDYSGTEGDLVIPSTYSLSEPMAVYDCALGTGNLMNIMSGIGNYFEMLNYSPFGFYLIEDQDKILFTNINEFIQYLTSITSPNLPFQIELIYEYAVESLDSMTTDTRLLALLDWTDTAGNTFSIETADGKTLSGLTKANYISEINALYSDSGNIDSAFPAKVSISPYMMQYAVPGDDYEVTSIGERVFSGCSSLTSITIGEGVTSIGKYAFGYCTSLTSITIPESVTSIGNYAFNNCTSLTSITIPESVTSIGEYTFNNCTSLTSITIPESVTSIGNNAFNNCTSLTSITIPDSVTSIGYGAFSFCTSLTSVTIPEGVTSIGLSAFYGCSSLTSITIPDSVTSIVDTAFGECSSLTSITIGEGVTSMGNYVFSDCTSLTDVTIESNYVYANAGTEYNQCGYLLRYVEEVRVLIGCIEDSTNSYLEDTATFTKTTSEDALYYIYRKI